MQALTRKLETQINARVDALKELVDFDKLYDMVPKDREDAQLLRQLSNVAFNGTQVNMKVVVPDENDQRNMAST